MKTRPLGPCSCTDWTDEGGDWWRQIGSQSWLQSEAGEGAGLSEAGEGDARWGSRARMGVNCVQGELALQQLPGAAARRGCGPVTDTDTHRQGTRSRLCSSCSASRPARAATSVAEPWLRRLTPRPPPADCIGPSRVLQVYHNKLSTAGQSSQQAVRGCREGEARRDGLWVGKRGQRGDWWGGVGGQGLGAALGFTSGSLHAIYRVGMKKGVDNRGAAAPLNIRPARSGGRRRRRRRDRRRRRRRDRRRQGPGAGGAARPPAHCGLAGRSCGRYSWKSAHLWQALMQWPAAGTPGGQQGAREWARSAGSRRGAVSGR